MQSQNMEQRIKEGLRDIEQRIKESRKKRDGRRQNLYGIEDLDLLLRGQDVLTIQRTDFPKCAPEDFLYMNRIKNHLIMWGTGINAKGKASGRVIKLLLENMQFLGSVSVRDYDSKFFELKERSFSMLHDAGLLW